MNIHACMNLRWAITLLLILLALPAHASDDSASGLQAFLWPAVNLIILIAVLVYFARKPLRAYFDKRRSDIQGELQTAADQLATAETTYATKAEARAWLATMETDILGGRHVNLSSGRELFGDYANRWLEARDLRPRTREPTPRSSYRSWPSSRTSS